MTDKLTKDAQKALEDGILHHCVRQVYVIQCGDYTKIGKTRGTLQNRIQGMATGNPIPMEVAYTFLTPYYTEVEKELHQMFAPSRVKGEWFKLTQKDWAILEAL